MDMLKAITVKNIEPLHTVELDGKEFVFECNADQLRNGIESLRLNFDNSKNRYGHQEYQGNGNVNLTEDEYQKHIDDFLVEFEKRLTYDYAKKIIKKAKKKKNGTFNKNRVYDDFVLKCVEDNGVGWADMYSIRCETNHDLIVSLAIRRGCVPVDYY